MPANLLSLCCTVTLLATVAVVRGAETTPAADMAFPAEHWEETSPQSQGLDPLKLAAAVEYLEKNSGRDGVRELVIARNGRIVWKGDNIDHVHGVWSCTKSFTSTVLGLLIEDGKCSLDTRAKQFAPQLAAHYGEMQLRHLTTMTSGYRAVGDEPQGNYKHGPSSTPFDPSERPLFKPPGSKYAYWDSAMNLLGLVLTKAAGEPMEQLFKRRIADPIGMDEDAWDWGDYATIDGVIVNGGSGNAGKHVLISARELARFGHLLLNKGRWDGKQLIDSSWIETATAVHVPASTPWAHPESDIDGRGMYGFNWWTNGTNTDGRRKWPDAPPATFAASGHNNNKLFVVPDWNMVIVRLGLDEADGKIPDSVWSTFLSLVAQSRIGDDEAPAEPRGGGRNGKVGEYQRAFHKLIASKTLPASTRLTNVQRWSSEPTYDALHCIVQSVPHSRSIGSVPRGQWCSARPLRKQSVCQ